MTKYEQDIKNVETYSPKRLAAFYKRICEVYAQRLCEMYDWYYEDCYWVSDDIGGIFCSSDTEYSFKMDEVRLLVDECVSYEDMSEWSRYNVMITYAQENEPDNSDYHFINLQSWLKGCPRIDMDELYSQEDIYWKKYRDKVYGDNSHISVNDVTVEKLKSILENGSEF